MKCKCDIWYTLKQITKSDRFRVHFWSQILNRIIICSVAELQDANRMFVDNLLWSINDKVYIHTISTSCSHTKQMYTVKVCIYTTNVYVYTYVVIEALNNYNEMGWIFSDLVLFFQYDPFFDMKRCFYMRIGDYF